MKTENTPEEKAKFFAQYYPQKIIHHKDYEDFCPVGFGSILSMDYYARNNYYLLLTPLKNISDEDAIEVIKILKSIGVGSASMRDPKEYLIKGSLMNQFGTFQLMAPVVDFLRSKSYLLPYKDLSTEDLIAYGWAKERQS